jgi:hypothetical protein
MLMAFESNYGGDPLSYHENMSEVDSNVVSGFDKTKRNYKTLVATAKNLKFSTDFEESANQTMIDTQASE